MSDPILCEYISYCKYVHSYNKYDALRYHISDVYEYIDKMSGIFEVNCRSNKQQSFWNIKITGASLVVRQRKGLSLPTFARLFLYIAYRQCCWQTKSCINIVTTLVKV